MKAHHCSDSVYERERIHEVELVHAEDHLVGKHDAGARANVHEDVQDRSELIAGQGSHAIAFRDWGAPAQAPRLQLHGHGCITVESRGALLGFMPAFQPSIECSASMQPLKPHA